MVFVGSHGEFSKICTSDIPVYINGNLEEPHLRCLQDIVLKLNNEDCPMLAGCPKIFIFQGCQNFADEEDGRTPLSDTAVLTAQVPGFPAYRDVCTASHFVCILTRFMMEHAHEKSLQEIMQETTKFMEK